MYLDYFSCPKCGCTAFRDQDNRAGEVVYGCSMCQWKGEPVEMPIRSNPMHWKAKKVVNIGA
jgi:uncharacterized Zn finger protein (UPF0148 family)